MPNTVENKLKTTFEIHTYMIFGRIKNKYNVCAYYIHIQEPEEEKAR